MTTQFSFTIVDPQNENLKRIIKTGSKIDKNCSLSNPGKTADTKTQCGTHEDNGGQRILIISCSIFGTLLVVIIILVVVASCMCFKRLRNKKVIKPDINVKYDRAGI